MNHPSAGPLSLFNFILIFLLLGSGEMMDHSHSFHVSEDAIIVKADKTGNERHQSLSGRNETFETPIQMSSYCPHSNGACCSKISVNNTAASNNPRVSRASSIDADKLSCGDGPYNTPNKIIGETDAVKNSWPSLVALVMNNQQYCGGTLIDTMHVVTAAHCVAHLTPRSVAKLKVALGMHTLKPKMDAQVNKKVRSVIYHRNFNEKTFYNDIALLTLESPVIFTHSISPVCLPPIHLDDQYAYRDAVTIGWGFPVQNGTQPNVLQQVTIQTISNSECRSIFRGVVLSGITDHMLCASYPGRDTCSGDSGGPLFVQSAPGGKWVQVGIVSWGVGCSEPDFPGVYIRVSSFVGWIKKHAVGRPTP